MKRFVFISVALLFGMAILSSCEHFDVVGKPVAFTASAKSDATKTIYSGNNTGTHEEIYWETGDQILIQSSDAEVVSLSSDPAVYSYVYTLTVDDDNKSLATINSDENGLAWNQSSAVTFYGVYPSTATPSGSTTKGLFDMTIPTAQSSVTYAETDQAFIFEPDMSHAYMVAKTPMSTAEDVSLAFYPVFTAFEINLKSANGSINLTRVAIKSESADLAGDFCSDWHESSIAFRSLSGGTNYKEVYLEFPGGITISQTKEVCFTLLALPYDLSGLYLEVTYEVSGTAITKKLNLKKDGNFINFTGRKKHRITGVALDGGADWRLIIEDTILPWDREDNTTSFSKNIESGPFIIKNAIETGNHYYPTGTKDYQVRTLNMDDGYTFFEVTFLPSAPLGGYWMLVPESNGGMGTAAFRVVIWDEESDPEDTPDLKGQIMNQTVTLRVISKVTDEQRTEDHAIIIKSYFSSSISFDEESTFSADSEIQDAHKDGSFSYWRFVIPAKNN